MKLVSRARPLGAIQSNSIGNCIRGTLAGGHLGEPHPARAPDPVRSPLVERAARPRARGDAGVGHDPGELRVVPERVELPRGGRRAAEHVALVADPVDRVADRRFGARQVGVGLVVGAADELEPRLGQELPDVLAVLRIGVPVGLEVVELGQHELVVGSRRAISRCALTSARPGSWKGARYWIAVPQVSVYAACVFHQTGS